MSDSYNKKNANILKVIELGLSDRIFEEMKKDKFSVELLTRRLKGEGIDITAQSIRKFIKKSKDAQKNLIKRDLRAAEEFKQLTLDYGKELKTILDEVGEVKELARTEKDFATYNQMIDKLYKGIELIAKLTGDIKPQGSVDINIIYNKINSNVESELKTLKNEIFKNSAINIDEEIVETDLENERRLKNR